MIACNLHNNAILLTHDDFVSLTQRLMADLPPLDSAAFKMAVAQNLAVGHARQSHQDWERSFRDRLIIEIEEGRFSPCYELNAQEAQDYIEDFLEVFRWSYKSINYAVGDIHDGSDEIINISLRGKRTILDRAMKRYGESYAEINLLKSDIVSLSGSSLQFTVRTRTLVYSFGSDGVNRG